MFPPQRDDPHRLVIRPFPYGVTLGTSGKMISRLPTRAPYEAANPFNQKGSLYTTFAVYLRP